MPMVADGSPTKDFFINMLTKDIDLKDAILDLLDNCLDGVIRTKGIKDKSLDKNYYQGFHARINISTSNFSLIDNCGGISKIIARDEAFRMGGQSTKENLPTVGIYGIGMKRAIFKIGKSAEVQTKNKADSFKVIISETWAKSTDWSFPIEDIDPSAFENDGTKIIISELTEQIQKEWVTNDSVKKFVDELSKAIKSNYSLIIEKGFEIFVNDKKIDGLPYTLLISSNDTGIKPYIFKKDYDSVMVSLIVGFYAPTPSDDEIDERNESRRSSGDAGWTVVCNDRVILYNDKTHYTGWGEAGIPQYHNQFIGIKGMVIFESDDPKKLPMTTTKRGIDLSSPIYADVKNKMREGIKIFITYTNQWKSRKKDEEQYSRSTTPVEMKKILEDTGLQEHYKISPKFNSKYQLSVYKPVLPLPPRNQIYRQIRFSRPQKEINELKLFFFDDENYDVTPSQIGEKCFDDMLERSRK